jgi:hypothetical protein
MVGVVCVKLCVPVVTMYVCCVCMYVCMYVYVCVDVCMYVRACGCVCVCVGCGVCVRYEKSAMVGCPLAASHSLKHPRVFPSCDSVLEFSLAIRHTVGGNTCVHVLFLAAPCSLGSGILLSDLSSAYCAVALVVVVVLAVTSKKGPGT